MPHRVGFNVTTSSALACWHSLTISMITPRRPRVICQSSMMVLGMPELDVCAAFRFPEADEGDRVILQRELNPFRPRCAPGFIVCRPLLSRICDKLLPLFDEFDQSAHFTFSAAARRAYCGLGLGQANHVHTAAFESQRLLPLDMGASMNKEREGILPSARTPVDTAKAGLDVAVTGLEVTKDAAVTVARAGVEVATTGLEVTKGAAVSAGTAVSNAVSRLAKRSVESPGRREQRQRRSQWQGKPAQRSQRRNGVENAKE